jgi:hypothetical protein
MRFSSFSWLDMNTRFVPSIKTYWVIFFYTQKSFVRNTLSQRLFTNMTHYTCANNLFGNPTAKIAKFNFNIWFLRKEKCYTKLKYSRTPAFDIISGGVAALFAGFLGFLVCEKFGFELLDSGDFYMLLMYIIFFIFSCRLWLRVLSASTSMSMRSIPLIYLSFIFQQMRAICIFLYCGKTK